LPPLRTSPAAGRPLLAGLMGSGRRTINEFDAKALLAGYGVPVARERRAATVGEAQAGAREIGFPVVLKALSDAIAHKTEHGLVLVNLKTPDELAQAWATLESRVSGMDEAPADVQFLVQEFVSGGVEVFAGVSRDPDFGLSIAFGIGGIAIEVTRDFALRMLPLREGDAEAMIAETRGAALLGPLRGARGADVGALAACIYALADFAVANADLIAEIDLNPIKAGPDGCTVVDALIVVRTEGECA
jgi:succinyl-CoA synthetase beta subunit